MITLRQLQIFVEVVRAGSFRRCGEKLGLSQVSISEQIRALELKLGVTLFDRVAGGAPIITEKGRRAHSRIAEILASVDELFDEMSEGASRKRVTLKVSMHSFMTRDLRQVLDKFSHDHPHVGLQIDCELHSQEELLDMVSRREFDLAYFFSADAPHGTRLVRLEDLGIFVSEDHPLLRQPAVDIGELAKTPALQLNRRNPLRIAVDRAFASVGISDRRAAIESDDFGMILGSAQRGEGYACLFEATAKEPSHLLGLKKVTLSRPLPPLQVRCAARRGGMNDATLGAFIEAVEDCWKSNALG